MNSSGCKRERDGLSATGAYDGTIASGGGDMGAEGVRGKAFASRGQKHAKSHGTCIGGKTLQSKDIMTAITSPSSARRQFTGAPLRRVRDSTAAVRDEVVRRAALAHRPQPPGVRTPPLRLLLAELGTGYECWRAWRRVDRAAAAQASRAQPVMLLPGFGTHPFRMRTLHRALTEAGHKVCDWGLGWNLGATPEKLDRLCEGLEALAEREGQPVALVGWSLGGLFAREAAKRLPDRVSLVVTMGSPFSGDLHANHAWRAYHWITGQDVREPPLPGDISVKPPVPTVALWSPRDGIVAPRSARGRASERDAAVALRCTHLGFASHPAVAATVLALLESDLAR